MIRRLSLSMLALSMTITVALAQRTVSGQVLDAETEEPLIGATVTIPGTATGTVTDVEGNFRIQLTDEESGLVVSYVGYNSKTINLSTGETYVTVSLELGMSLDEVVVTALGIAREKEELTYATQTVTGKSFNVARTGDVAKQLRGLVPGLTISSNAGSGVSSSRVTLRGESSLDIGNNQPLIILDGVPISNDFNGVTGGNSRTNTPIDYGDGLSDINPDDIRDITVLKGPKAAALYGTRAANGALVITTTDGSDRQGLGITYTTGVSFNSVTRFWDVQNEFSGGQYIDADDKYEYRAYGGYGLPLDGSLAEQTQVETWYTGAGTAELTEPRPLVSRFKSKDFFETGVTFNNYLSFAFKNTDNLSGRISFSRQNSTGIVPNTGYDRNTFATHIQADLNDKLNVALSANYVNSFSDNVPTQGLGDDSRESLIYALIWAPNNININAYKNNYWVFNDKGVRRERSAPAWITNPIIITEENLNSFDRDRIFGNFKLTYQFTDDLYGFVRVGTDRYTDRRTSRRPIGLYYFPTGMYREQTVDYTEVNADFVLNYTKRFGDVGLNANVGGNILTQESSDNQTRVDQLSILDVYGFANALDRPQINQSNIEKQINSLYGSVQLDHQEKFFLDLTGRNDWSSALPSNANSFFYPSVGLSFIVSKIVDMPSAIDHLRVRINGAQTGNDTDAQIINSPFLYGTLPGSNTNPQIVVDPNIRPERTTAVEVGLNIRLLQSKIDLEANYYKNSTKDQILRVPISRASGATTRLLNAGLIENSGVEILWKNTIIDNNVLTWNFDINWSANRGKVVELAEDVDNFIIAQGPDLPGVLVQAVPGGRMGDIYGRDYKRHNGDIIWSEVGNIAAATYADDLVNVGNYNPDWISGLVSTLTYKDVSLRIVGEYRNGGVLFTETGARLYQAGKDSETLARTANPTVVPQGVMSDGEGGFVPNTISAPYFRYARRIRNWENAALNTFDATFFKLREVSIAVDLKPYLFPNSPLTRFNLSIFGRNLATWTKSRELRHFDPESFMIDNGNLVPGVESGQLPTPTTYGFNLSIGI